MRGSVRYSKGDLDGSILDFTRAIEINPHMDQAYYNRGKARTDKGDLDGSINDYSKTIEINPRLSAAYNNRGNVRRVRGDLDGALADFDKAIWLDSHNAPFYNNRGLVRRAKGDLQGAIADYDRAVRINPRLADAYSNRGNTFQDLGDLGQHHRLRCGHNARAIFRQGLRKPRIGSPVSRRPGGSGERLRPVSQAGPHVDTRPARANRESEAEVPVEAIAFSCQVLGRVCDDPRMPPTTISAEVTVK